MCPWSEGHCRGVWVGTDTKEGKAPEPKVKRRNV